MDQSNGKTDKKSGPLPAFPFPFSSHTPIADRGEFGEWAEQKLKNLNIRKLSNNCAEIKQPLRTCKYSYLLISLNGRCRMGRPAGKYFS